MKFRARIPKLNRERLASRGILFSSELLNALQAFDLSYSQLMELGRNAIDGAFVSTDMRNGLRDRFERQSSRLCIEAFHHL